MSAPFARFDGLIAELVRIQQPVTVLIIGDHVDHYGPIVQTGSPVARVVGVTDPLAWMRLEPQESFDLVILACGIQSLLKSVGVDLIQALTSRAGCMLIPVMEYPAYVSGDSVAWPFLPRSVWGRADWTWSDAWAHGGMDSCRLYLLRGWLAPLPRFVQWIRALNPLLHLELILADPCALEELPLAPEVSEPPRPTLEALRLAAESAMTDQRVDEALGLVRHIKQAYPEPDPLTGEFAIRVTEFVVQCFNGALRVGNLKEAERVISIILELFPVNKELLKQALMIQIQLGQTEEALVLRERLVDYCQQHGETQEEITQRLYLVENHLHRMSPLYALYSVNRLLDLLLSGNLDPATVEVIDGLTQRSRIVSADSLQPGTMEMFFRVAIDNIRIRSLYAPTPEYAPWPAIWFSSAEGRLLTPEEVAAQAEARVVRAVFFVAGDAVYVQRFGKLYAASVLKNCDLSCQVVIHVIGAGPDVTGIARSLGLQDPRLIFSSDGFDPDQVTSRCHTTPPFTAHPLAAHYQSARFLWLGYMMTLFNQPIFVSDIDLILQRGVADLLETHVRDDVVLLRDPDHPNYQTYNNKFHAGLILLNPTAIAHRMVRFIRNDLEIALRQPEIDRWVDQVTLMMSHHHIAQFPETRVALFGPLDINRDLFVLTTYTETPYRFFAMANFIEFDIESYYNHFMS